MTNETHMSSVVSLFEVSEDIEWPDVSVGGAPYWTHRTPPLQGLSLHFAVQCTDRELGLYLQSLLSPLRVDSPEVHVYSLVSQSDGAVNMFFNDAWIDRLPDPSTAVDRLLQDLNQKVVEESPELLLFHAGGLQSGDVGILLPAPSGSGKSTLVAALVRDGLGYLSDELMAVTSSGAQLLPYQKPLALKSGSFELLCELKPVLAPAWAEFAGEQWHVPATQVGTGSVGQACTAGLVILPHYIRGGSTSLRRLHRAETFLSLAVNSVNIDAHGGQGAQLLGDLVEQCECYELEMSDLNEACRLVFSLLAN